MLPVPLSSVKSVLRSQVNMPNRDENEGGQAALAGYLYQILGVCGMKAKLYRLHRSTEDTEADEPSSSDIEELFLLMRRGSVQHEAYGQDAVIRRYQHLGINESDQCILVQFKYSQHDPTLPIYPKELRKILDRLHTSAQWASREGEQVTGNVLITNRELSPGAKELRDAAKNDKPHKDLDDKQRAILRGLRLPSPSQVAWSTWIDELKNFARSYGEFDQEIQNGIATLIGHILLRTEREGTPYIELADLINAFTGSKDAQPLTPEQIWEHNKHETNTFMQLAGIQFEAILRRPAILEEIRRLVEEGHALIFLIGGGGCGKTVSAIHWVRDTVTSAPKTMNAYATILSAKHVQRDCLQRLISQWRNLRGTQHGLDSLPEQALERLCIANPHGQHPLLYLSIDELDENIENTEQGNIVYELLKWFWTKDIDCRGGAFPRATLIVTARDKKDINNWLKVHPQSSKQPVFVKVNDFTIPELKTELELAENHALPAASSRLLNALQLRLGQSTTSLSDDTFSLLPITNPFTSPVDEQMLDSLLHPVIWGEFLRLDSEAQSHILDGNAGAKHRLAGKYIKWFCWKAYIRGLWPKLQEEEVLAILKNIARYCGMSNPARHSRNDWNEYACSTKIVNEREAGSLYREAESSGLINIEGLWRWRHQFVYDFLVNSQN